MEYLVSLASYGKIMFMINSSPSKVEEINIDWINLRTLPDLSRCVYLQKLDCSHNRLTRLDNLPSSLQELNCSVNELTRLDNIPLSLMELYCPHNKIELNNLEYWKKIIKNKKLKILKEKISARKIQKIWRKYWYDFYKYELIYGKYIGFCRFIEKSYSIINESSI